MNVQIDNKNPLFNTQLSIDNVTSKYYNISKLQLVNITLNDTLYFRTEFDGGIDKTEKYNLAFYHTFNKENKSVFGLQKSDFTFKNNKWVINPKNNLENKVVYDNKTKTYNFSPFLVCFIPFSLKKEISLTVSVEKSFLLMVIALNEISLAP